MTPHKFGSDILLTNFVRRIITHKIKKEYGQNQQHLESYNTGKGITRKLCTTGETHSRPMHTITTTFLQAASSVVLTSK